MFLEWLFGIIVYVLFCVLVGKCAERWDRSFGKYLALSLIFSPLIMGLILLILGKNVSTASYVSNNRQYVAPEKNDEEEYIPLHMRLADADADIDKPQEKKVDLSEIPKTSIIIDEYNLYYDNDINSKKWICGKCGTVNKIKIEKCKKCENEKGVLKKD